MFWYLGLPCLLATPTFAADAHNKILLLRSIEINVEQSMIVHGFRGQCGERPTNVDPNRTRNTKLGILRNGRWGVTNSRKRGGWTPAVEITFEARRKGRETIKVAGVEIQVRVK